MKATKPLDCFVTVNGLRLHYLDWGNEAAPPLLLLHGGMQTAHTWDFFAASVCDRYHVVALDQRGHGDSDWAPDGHYHRDAYLADLAAFTAAIGFDRFALIGLSMGGRNAICFTATHPERVKALVACDVGPEVKPEGVEAIRRFALMPDELDTFEEFVERAHQFNPRRSKESLRGSLSHSLKQLPNGKWTWKYDRLFRDPLRRPQPTAGERASLWDYLAKIACPTLVVVGAHSDVMSPEVGQKMLSVLPAGSELAVVPNAGHVIHGDNPEGFEQVVVPFLARWARGA